jgi:hypothetical protein
MHALATARQDGGIRSHQNDEQRSMRRKKHSTPAPHIRTRTNTHQNHTTVEDKEEKSTAINAAIDTAINTAPSPVRAAGAWGGGGGAPTAGVVGPPASPASPACPAPSPVGRPLVNSSSSYAPPMTMLPSAAEAEAPAPAPAPTQAPAPAEVAVATSIPLPEVHPQRLSMPLTQPLYCRAGVKRWCHSMLLTRPLCYMLLFVAN